MPNFNYKNVNDILLSKEPIRGLRTSTSSLTKTVVPKFNNLILNSVNSADSIESVEIHVFNPLGGYITSLYDLQSWKIDVGTDNKVRQIHLDVHRDIFDLKLQSSTYRVVYNFFRNFIGGAFSSKMFISDISSDRKELKVSLSDPENQIALEQLRTFVLDYLTPKTYLPPIVLNFGENQIIDVINVTSDGSRTSFFVKLFDPLPTDIELYYEFWVASQIIKPYIDLISIEQREAPQFVEEIAGPNFDAEIDYWITTETDYKSWTDLLSTNVQTSQEILNRYIFDSGSTVKLNLDFREFGNFVFYASAEDRVENFLYKVGLIETYNGQLDTLNSYSGSFTGSLSNGVWTAGGGTGSYSTSFGTNKITIANLRNKVISGFDEFEKWLYYETTASNYYTYQEDSSVTPFPKYSVTGSDYHIATKEGKYKLYKANSNEVITWYEDLLDKATDFDMRNDSALRKTIPDFIGEDDENSAYITFINMIGQHFDIMYWYTNHLTKKNERIENPKDGLSQDLVYLAAKNMGWTLSHGTQAKDLWEYALGVSGSGDPIWTGKTTTNRYNALTYEERTKEVWRRILNNLPYIYKTKGTARGIKALLTAYGIPKTVLSIREYGGPDNADFGMIPRAEWEKHTYFLNFKGTFPTPTHQHHIRTPWERVYNTADGWSYSDALTFRWRMEPDKYHAYGADSIQTILQKNSGSRVDWFVTATHDGTDPEKGSLRFYLGDGTNYATASITDEYLYDDIPLNILIRRSSRNDATGSNQIYDFILKTGKYGKIAVERSASIVVSGSLSGSYNRAWSSDGQLFIGSGSNPQTNNILSGSVFELRYWSNPLTTSSFDNHVLAPRSYNGNTPTSSFYDLKAQWKFWQKFDAAATSSLLSSHPNQKENKFYSSSKVATLLGLTEGSFEPLYETYNMEVPSVAGDTPFTEKARIDSGSLYTGLSHDTSAEISMFDAYSIDSNKLMVAFSPQTIINEDIYEAIGYTPIDNYFGYYDNMYSTEYPQLKRFAREYWQKYENKNDFTAYINLISIYDFSVFEQIRQTLPARVNPILGLAIEPNVLERSKVIGLRGISAIGGDATVKETEDLSKLPIPSAEINSKKTLILVGFDEELNLEAKSVSSDLDLNFKMSGDGQDLIQEKDVDVKYTPYISNVSKITYIESSTIKPKTTVEYKPRLMILSGSNSTPKLNLFNTDKNASLDLGLKSTTGKLNPAYSCSFDDSFTTTYARTNINWFSDSAEDVGFGYGWDETNNSSGAATAVFTSIQKYASDNFYSKYNFAYTSSADAFEKNYSSYYVTTSSYLNPHNSSTPTKNRAFDGCKLSSPDINQIDYDNQGPWQPCVERSKR
jgi:hypothetical protein